MSGCAQDSLLFCAAINHNCGFGPQSARVPAVRCFPTACPRVPPAARLVSPPRRVSAGTSVSVGVSVLRVSTYTPVSAGDETTVRASTDAARTAQETPSLRSATHGG